MRDWVLYSVCSASGECPGYLRHMLAVEDLRNTNILKSLAQNLSRIVYSFRLQRSKTFWTSDDESSQWTLNFTKTIHCAVVRIIKLAWRGNPISCHSPSATIYAPYFSGSAWMALSRKFVEFMIWGWDNLPRTLLMYHANIISTPEFYFHTVICNSPEFRNTTVNSDLHYISWDNPPKQHPRSLGLRDFRRMVQSNAPFARKFKKNDPVLDKIDRELLGRNISGVTPGGWCIGKQNDPCLVVGDKTYFKPGPGSKRLGQLISRRLTRKNFRVGQCK